MYAAIDLVMDKIDMQLKKFRDKLRDLKGDRSRSAALMTAAAESPARPLLRRKRTEVPALLLSDALEMMQTGNNDLLVFTNVASGGLNILYKRQDGSFVLVEPDLG
jgi:putative sigma-54 modulation protein